MLDLKYIRDNLDILKQKFEYRNCKIDLDRFKIVDRNRRDLLARIENLKHQKNELSCKISVSLSESSDEKEATLLKNMGSRLSEEIKNLEINLKELEKELRDLQSLMPNICTQDVPIGKSEEDNIDVRVWGEPKKFSFSPLPHWEIGTTLGIIDFETASKLSGARFSLMKGKGAKLERALISFMIDIHTSRHGYLEILPPHIVSEDTMFGSGQLPKFKDDAFITDDGMFLIPTSEVCLANLHKGEVLQEHVLPLYYTAYTPCFRKEAGSYGKDTKGLIRLHQFNKVELVKIVKPEYSYEELEKLVREAEFILQELELPYKVVLKCTGDTGFTSSKTYDIEVWFPEQQRYREISSCSNTEDFQARRTNTKFREKGQKKSEFVHMLNGSGLAVGRTVAAIMENYQNEDKTISIPKALQKYMGGDKIIS